MKHCLFSHQIRRPKDDAKCRCSHIAEITIHFASSRGGKLQISQCCGPLYDMLVMLLFVSYCYFGYRIAISALICIDGIFYAKPEIAVDSVLIPMLM